MVQFKPDSNFGQARNSCQGQKHLIAEFLANIGVAWFAAGVIGVFLGGAKSLVETAFSVSWGLLDIHLPGVLA